jgi:hypothetical protein
VLLQSIALFVLSYPLLGVAFTRRKEREREREKERRKEGEI